MSSVITSYGREWFNDREDGLVVPEEQYVAVGTGTRDPAGDNEELSQEKYRGTKDGNNVTLNYFDGEISGWLALSGGVEIDPGIEITEFGIFDADEELIYREVRDPIVLETGHRKLIEFEVETIST